LSQAAFAFARRILTKFILSIKFSPINFFFIPKKKLQKEANNLDRPAVYAPSSELQKFFCSQKYSSFYGNCILTKSIRQRSFRRTNRLCRFDGAMQTGAFSCHVKKAAAAALPAFPTQPLTKRNKCAMIK